MASEDKLKEKIAEFLLGQTGDIAFGYWHDNVDTEYKPRLERYASQIIHIIKAGWMPKVEGEPPLLDEEERYEASKAYYIDGAVDIKEVSYEEFLCEVQRQACIKHYGGE